MIYSSADEAAIGRAWELAAELEDKAGHDDQLARALGQTIVGGVISLANQADSARAVLERARLTPDVDPDLEIMGYPNAPIKNKAISLPEAFFLRDFFKVF